VQSLFNRFDRAQVILVTLLMTIMLMAVNAYRPVTAELAEIDLQTPTSPAWHSYLHLSANASFGAFAPSIKTAPNGNLMVVYSQRLSNGKHNSYYRSSIDNGQTWQPPSPIHISPNSNIDSTQVKFAFSPTSQAHAIWREGNSLDNGSEQLLHATQSQWSTNSVNVIRSVTSPHHVFDPAIAAGNANVLHAVWSQTEANNNRNIYYARSSDGGATWPPSAVVPLASAFEDSERPSVAIDQNGNVHVVWEEPSLDFSTGVPLPSANILYRRGLPNGTGWTAPIALSPSEIKARRPLIIAHGNTIHVSFTREDSRDHQFAYYVFSTNGGQSWSTPVNTSQIPIGVNDNQPFFLDTALGYCHNRAYVYYHGTYTPTANEQIYGANSSLWSSRDQVTTGTARTVYPSLACNSMVHLVYEQIGTSHQVFYSRAYPFRVLLPVIRK
jgi:hypothetical protein